MILLQIRGIHGTGKTSMARAFLQEGNFEQETIEICGNRYPLNIDRKRNVVVTGRYGDAKCGGLDGKITDRRVMLEYLYAIMQRKPELIVFEAVMYGITTQFTKDLDAMCRKLGYEFKAVALYCEFEEILQRIYTRNGGKRFDIDTLYKKCKSSDKANHRLLQTGINMRIIDTTNITKEEAFARVKRYLSEKGKTQ